MSKKILKKPIRSDDAASSIKGAEIRPDLDDFCVGQKVNPSKSRPGEKPSLPDHLYNPYIYIKKVYDKKPRKQYQYSEEEEAEHQKEEKRGKERLKALEEERKFGHPEIWNTSNNTRSLRRPKTAKASNHEGETGIRPSTSKSKGRSTSKGPGNSDDEGSPDEHGESPSKKLSKEERAKQQAENANMRKYVHDYFENVSGLLMQKQQQLQQQTRENEEYPLERLLVKLFADYCKEKKINFTKTQDDKFVDFATFQNFMFYIGFDSRFDIDIEKFFDYFAENTGSEKNPIFKISIKSFLFNYKKFIKEKFKIKFILSAKFAQQRNVDIKLTLKEFLNSYDEVRQHFKGIKLEEPNLRTTVIKYELSPQYQPKDRRVSLIDEFNRLVERKNNLILEKKYLARFLELRNKENPESAVDIGSIEALLNKIRNKKAEDLTIVGNFIHEFKREKQLFKEDNFNLFELANFIHEKKISKEELENISYFVDKLKKFFNYMKGYPATNYVDPRTPLPNSSLSNTFDKICTKAEKQNDILSDFLKKLEDYYQANRGDAVVDRVNITIEQNIVGDYIIKYFEDIDRGLLAELDKLEELGRYIKEEDLDETPEEKVRETIWRIITGEELVLIDPETKNLAKKISKALFGDKNARLEAGVKNQANDEDDDLVAVLNERKNQNLGGLNAFRPGEKKDFGYVNLQNLDGDENETGNLQNKKFLKNPKIRSLLQDLKVHAPVMHAKIVKDIEENPNLSLSGFMNKFNEGGYAQSMYGNLGGSFVNGKFDFLGVDVNDNLRKSIPPEKHVADYDEVIKNKDKRDELFNWLSENPELSKLDMNSIFAPKGDMKAVKKWLGLIKEVKKDELTMLLEGTTLQPAKSEQKAEKPLTDFQTRNNLVSDQDNEVFNMLNSKSPNKYELDRSLVIDDKLRSSEKFGDFSNKKSNVGFNDSQLSNNRKVKDTANLDPRLLVFQELVNSSVAGGHVNPKALESLQRLQLGQGNDGVQDAKVNEILKKAESLAHEMDHIKDPKVLVRSTLKERTDEIPFSQDAVLLGRSKPKTGRFSDYEALLPPDYYTFIAKKNIQMDDNKWFLRGHHIETLTENPRSVKDNLMGAEYVSYYAPIPKTDGIVAAKKEILGYENKADLIRHLENERERLKNELEKRTTQRNPVKFADAHSLKESAKYYESQLQKKKEGPELLTTAYEGILDELRKKERELLNHRREQELVKLKPPTEKWWELKDKSFIDEYVKHVQLSTTEPEKIEDYYKYIEQLNTKELF